MKSRSKRLLNHIGDHRSVYTFMIILFLTGIIFGAIIVNSMSFIQKQDLFFHLERYFGQVAEGEKVKDLTILTGSFFYHIRYLLLLFLLGLSVIGLPIVWILLFVKGLVVGFSVGFIVNQLGLKGLLLATLSIAPQNLIIIPIYITAGSLAMIFSLTLLGKLFIRKIQHPILQPLGQYVAVFSLLIAISFSGAFLEAFVANESMHTFIKSMYSS